MENQTLNTNNQTNVSNELTQNLPSTKVIQTDVVATPQQRVSLPSTQPTQVTQPVQPTSVIDGALNQIKLNESEQQAVNAEQNIVSSVQKNLSQVFTKINAPTQELNAVDFSEGTEGLPNGYYVLNKKATRLSGMPKYVFIGSSPPSS